MKWKHNGLVWLATDANGNKWMAESRNGVSAFREYGYSVFRNERHMFTAHSLGEAKRRADEVEARTSDALRRARSEHEQEVAALRADIDHVGGA